MYRTLHLISEEYTFFLYAHGTNIHQDRPYIGPSLTTFKKIEIQQDMFSDYNRLKIEFGITNISGKSTNI